MEMALAKKASEYFMDRERVIRLIDNIIVFCFCVLVFFLPIARTETIRAFSFGIPVGLWIIKMILTRQWLFSSTELDLPILLFSIVGGLSLITAVDFWYSLDEFQGEWLMGVLLFYLTVNNLRPEQMKYILGALLAGNLLMVGYGIFEFFRDGGILFNYGSRATSLHSGEGTFSTYLITIIPYLVVGLFFKLKAVCMLTMLPVLSLNLFALILTYSRGSWVAMVPLAFWLGSRFVSKKVLILSFFLAGLGIYFIAPQTILYYYQRFTKPGVPDSYHGRWIVAKFSLEKIKENPFRMLGFGQRSFIKKYRDFAKIYEKVQLWHAHNTFLNIATQTGIQGLILFCYLLYKILKYCHERARLESDASRKFYFSATFMMVITFFIRNLSDDFFIDDSALLFWFLAGLVFVISNNKGKNFIFPTGYDKSV